MADLWVCVHTHRGYEIKVLFKAELGDQMGYRVGDRIFDTVAEAMEWIDTEERK